MIKETQMQYDPREARQMAHVEALESWYEREMDALDADFMQGGMTQAQYESAVKALNREFDEDYNDIFAG
jgi:hypothetical protein